MKGFLTRSLSEMMPMATTATASADQNQLPSPFASDWLKPKTDTK